ncbi:protein kinase [Myxococcota bacterium]|nr:protein kinase [Myxococcota bacterium]
MLEATLDRRLWVCLQCGHTEAQSHTLCPRCGAGEDPLVGKVLGGRYRLLQKMAEGGMGAVYRAEHTTLKSKKERAVKIIHARFLSDAMMRKRFIQEVESTHRVGQETQHVVHIHDNYGFEDGLGWYVMELLQGESLAARLSTFPQGVPLRWFQTIAQQICEGLEAIHQEHLVHRDLKPANLFLIDKKGQDFVKIVDFGIAKPLDLDVALTSTQALIGTPAYMSPEQIEPSQSHPLDHRSDIYSLGCVFYEMLTGRPPFLLKHGPASPMALHEILTNHVMCKPDPPTRFRPQLPLALAKLIERMLAKSPEERPQSVFEVHQILRKIPIPEGDELPKSLTDPSQKKEATCSPPHRDHAVRSQKQDFFPHEELPHTPRPAPLRWGQDEKHREPKHLPNIEPFPSPNTAQTKQHARYLWIVPVLLFLMASAYFAWPLFRGSATVANPQTTAGSSLNDPQQRATHVPSLAKAHRSGHPPVIPPNPPSSPLSPPRSSVPSQTREPKASKQVNSPTSPVPSDFVPRQSTRISSTHRPPRSRPRQRWHRIRLTLPPAHKLRLLSSTQNARLYKKYLLMHEGKRLQMELQHTSNEAFRFFRCVFTISSQQKHLTLQPLVSTDDFRPNSEDYCTKP